MSLDFLLNEAQVHLFDSLNPGLGSVDLGRIESTGPVLSFGLTQNLGSDVALGVKDPNILEEVPVCNVPESDWGQKEKSVGENDGQGHFR